MSGKLWEYEITYTLEGEPREPTSILVVLSARPVEEFFSSWKLRNHEKKIWKVIRREPSR